MQNDRSVAFRFLLACSSDSLLHYLSAEFGIDLPQVRPLDHGEQNKWLLPSLRANRSNHRDLTIALVLSPQYVRREFVARRRMGNSFWRCRNWNCRWRHLWHRTNDPGHRLGRRSHAGKARKLALRLASEFAVDAKPSGTNPVPGIIRRRRIS